MKIGNDAFRGKKIFAYKLINDDGGAPCVHANALSLSICKPRIRMSAEVGDWIIGFGGKSVANLKNRLIYIAKLTSIEDGGAYYRMPEYHSRPDCIYRPNGRGGYDVIDNLFHGKESIPHDLGAPGRYERARNLLSSEFVYFGNCKSPTDDGHLERVMRIYDSLPRDFRKNHSEEDRKSLELFIRDIFTNYPKRVYGKPTHADPSAPFNQGASGTPPKGRCS